MQAVPDIANDPNYVVVTIDADDAVYVEDEEALSEQDLRAKLRAAHQERRTRGMMINGAADSTHGKFVMVLDAGADAGMKEILFSVPQGDEAAFRRLRYVGASAPLDWPKNCDRFSSYRLRLDSAFAESRRSGIYLAASGGGKLCWASILQSVLHRGAHS